MPAKPNEKILVVDDDLDVLDLVVQQVLQPQGYQVSTAQDGASALQQALQNAPDILITSLELPGLSRRDLMTPLPTQPHAGTLIATAPPSPHSPPLPPF